MSTPPTVTRQLATYAAKLRYRDLPPEVVAIAKTAVLNIVAAAIGGAQTRIGRVHLELAKQLGGGAGRATLIGDGGRVSPAAAAYANGGLAFALDYEDVCQYVIHPGPIVVPAALAVGESLRAGGRQLLASVVAGYEVGTRIGWAMQPSPERGAQVWGQQYTPFAPCAAVGNLLGLDAVQMDAAFGVTGTYAPVPSAYKYFGIVAETRPMREAKLGWGWMSMAGTMGALSSAAGLRGGHGILDGREGFWIMAGSDRCDFPKMLQGLGTEWLILGTDFKLHPSIAWSHPPYVALTRLIQQHGLRPAQIAKARVWNVGVSRIADFNPAGAVDAQFSLPYAVATTLLGLPLTPALYADRTLRSAKVRAMLARVECLPDESMDMDWFTRNVMRTRVELTLTDGRVLEAAAQFPGDKPKYGRDEVIAKLVAMSDGLLNAARVEQIVTTVDRLEKLADVRALVKLLVPAPARRARRGSSRSRPRSRPARRR
jgi:2-methylcitrate dehydratase PrpD